MKSSTAVTCASVAPVTLVSVVASFCAAASSSANAFTAEKPATARPPMAAAAGSAAFWIANDALAPTPSSFLKSAIALLTPEGFHSETRGREMATSGSPSGSRPSPCR